MSSAKCKDKKQRQKQRQQQQQQQQEQRQHPQWQQWQHWAFLSAFRFPLATHIDWGHICLANCKIPNKVGICQTASQTDGQTNSNNNNNNSATMQQLLLLLSYWKSHTHTHTKREIEESRHAASCAFPTWHSLSHFHKKLFMFASSSSSFYFLLFHVVHFLCIFLLDSPCFISLIQFTFFSFSLANK